MSFLDQIQKRRTIYNIGKNVTLVQSQIDQLIRDAIKHSPSAFNSQSSRAVILFGDSHVKYWTFVLEALRKIVPTDAFATTEAKINSFSAGFGTVLFYEDQDVVKGLQEKFALYADNFPIWSQHSSAIAQFSAWTTLSDNGIGASLQHYSPLGDTDAAEAFAVPANWKLNAQLVFGSIEAPADEKTYIDDSLRFKSFD